MTRQADLWFPVGVTRILINQIERDMLSRGWNRRELARASRVSEATITRFLSAQYQTAKTLKSIAFALDRQIDDYLGGAA